MGKQRWAVITAGAVVTAGSLALAPAATTTAAVNTAGRTFGGHHVKRHDDPRLGNGLGRLVQQAKQPATKKNQGLVSDQSKLAIKDSRGRIKVDLTPQAGVDRAAFRSQAQANGLVVTAVDAKHGTLEGFVPLASVKPLAALKGTGTITQALRPVLREGAATSQGVVMQRVDKLLKKGINGKGITVGVLSDSFDDATNDVFGDKLTIHAAQDVKSGDLPGPGNKAYPHPVVVLQDGGDPQNDTDEGRAMLQIVHDIAPAAKLCFATANGGTVGFADNIRKLADKSGKCGADVVVDDVGYFDEPFFSDNIIGDAINDITAKGAHYFSSAGNDGEQQSWDSPVRLVSAKQGVKGTNLDFSQVDPSLYSGGLQDMNTGPGTDVAQDIVLGEGGGYVNVQWDDPVDVNGAQYGKTYLSKKGALTDAQHTQSYTFSVPQADVGKKLLARTDAIPSGTTDLTLSLTGPGGEDIATDVDSGSSPEVYAFTPTKTGTYTVTVGGFNDATGDFVVDVREVVGPSRTSTDFNLLFFDEHGSYLGASADDNPATGRPQELYPIGGKPKVQLVIARAGTGPVGATHIRDILYSDAYFDEYVNPLAPAIYGHPLASGATAVAAYDPFKPFLPEYYTSPGGNMAIKFDSSGNKYSSTQYRKKPDVAGIDRGNTTFFVADDPRDPDSQPNFGGTSASAPHVAAIAALMLQKAGGPRSLSPSTVKSRLKSSAFAHDLDPMHAGGSAGGVVLWADGPQGSESDVANGPMTDRNFFKLGYTGSGRVQSVTLFGNTASPTSISGMVFDPRKEAAAPNYYAGGFPFTVGTTVGGLARSAVSASFAGTGAGDSVAGQYTRMTVKFAQGLARGQGLSFGVDRDLATSGFGDASEGNGADELGGATLLPSGTVVQNGLKFVATLSNGKTVTGYVRNKIGAGFSPVDGYGLVNAEKAVLGN